MEEFREEMRNGLTCSIDWLSFTITDKMTLHNVLGMFGLERTDFYECDKGASGYKQMLIMHGANVRVLYDGNDNMGIHFDVSGSAVGDFVEHYRQGVSELTPWDTYALDMDIRLVSHMLERVEKHGHVTRLDLAIDDKGTAFYSVEELNDVLLSGNFVSKFRSWRSMQEYKISGEAVGRTVYLGSRSSSVMLRVYDKRLEQDAKQDAPPESPNDGGADWIRWEFELKGERAEMAAAHIIQGLSIGELCVGILAQYFRMIERDDSNKSRCSITEKWQLFIDGIQALRLFVQHIGKTLDDKRNWVLKQVAPTLTGLILANYGDMGFITDHLQLHAQRMKNDLRDLVTEKNPGWESSFKLLNLKFKPDEFSYPDSLYYNYEERKKPNPALV